MCGIAGALSTGAAEPLTPASVAAMADAMEHRGPDDGGHWQGDGATLLHRRLAIQDLSPLGHQPMQSPCGRYVLVFNGEIYNQRDIRARLEARGERFVSSGDTEVLLRLLSLDGTAALAQLQGMYAFCFWDRRLQRALLARDPFGIKPLYLAQPASGQLLFASEVRTLLASGRVTRSLDPQALASYLQRGSLPQTATLVAGITALPPGHLGIWRQGHWHTTAFWQPSYAPELPLSYPQLVERTRESLRQSVQSHLLADVPVGLFLSGGLDSASVLALAGPGLTTLSIGFEEEGFDESALAAQLAQRFGAHHQPLLLRREQAWQRLPQFLSALDQPSIDGFNTYCVAGLAAEAGLKVVMSGLGGDELFGGYPSFRRLPQWLRWRSRLGPAAPLAARWLRRRGAAQSQRLAHLLEQPPQLAVAHGCLRGVFAPREIDRLFRSWGLEPLSPGVVAHSPAAELVADLHRCPTEADAIAWLESSTYMGDMLLRDSDALSMAHGLELRLPLVDTTLFRALAAQPAHVRLAPAKQLLRDAMPEVQAVIGDGPKQGFVFPFQRWFEQSHFGGHGLDALPPLPPIPPGLDMAPWARRWGLMVLADWLRRHLDLDLGAV